MKSSSKAARDSILQELMDIGQGTCVELALASGYPFTSARKTLCELRERGWVRKASLKPLSDPTAKKCAHYSLTPAGINKALAEAAAATWHPRGAPNFSAPPTANLPKPLGAPHGHPTQK